MKRFITKLIALTLSLAFVLGICASCDWVTVNTDRDMNQVIATVKVSDSVDAEDIKKKELNAGYLSYGYQYVSYYGYTTSQAYQVVFDNLISNRIIIQEARMSLAETYNGLLSKSENLTDFESYYKANALANGTAIDPRSSSVENLKNFLTPYEYAEVMYNARKNVNDFIESYEDEEDEDEEETETVNSTERTSPASSDDDDDDRTEAELKEAKPDEDEVKIAEVTIGVVAASKETVYDLNMAVYETYKIDISTSAKKKAFSQVLAFLKENGLVLSTESQDLSDPDNILQYSYFQSMVKSLIENVIVDKYEESLKAGVEAKLTDEGIWDEYVKEYQNQEATYKNDISAYETALDAVSDTSFVLYNPFSDYGYVLNLLIPFSDEQSSSLSTKQAEKGITQADITAYRQSLAANIVAKDQRESWVYLSNGTYNKDSKTFTFASDYMLSELDSIKNFVGEVVVRSGKEDGTTKKDDNGVDQTTWSFANVVASEISMTNFFKNYVTPATGIEEIYFVENDDSTIGQVSYSQDLFDKFNDLMYAFSTDTGCLGEYYGYLYTPYNSSYVAEFTAAAKAVVAKGAGAYTTVLTDYGYHIILCTKTVSTTYDTSAESKAKFIEDLKSTDTLAYKYRQVKLDSIVDSEISKIANKYVNEFKDDTTKVTKYSKTYSDLITD